MARTYVTAYWYSKNAAASLFGTGPCWGWTANQLLGWIHYGGGRELYEELLRDVLKLDIVGFFSGPMPAQPLGWFRKEIAGVGDMKGLKYRTVGLAANVMQEMGMSVVQLPGGEIQPAMERGLIDAAEFNNPTSDKDFGMQDVAKNYYLASFHQSQESFEIIFNQKKFESLSKEQQAILRYAAEAASVGHVLEGPGSLLQRPHRRCRKSMGSRSTARRTRSWLLSSLPGTRCCRSSWKTPYFRQGRGVTEGLDEACGRVRAYQCTGL